MKGLISVIVPVYNVERFLDRCVESIVRQTYRNIEIILIDDGSTDTSSQICDKLALTDPRIRVIHKTNGGLSSARNRGMLEAKGEFFGFVDSDDCIRKDMYEVLLKNMIENNSDIVKSDFQTFLDENELFKHKGNGEVTIYDSETALDDFIFSPFSGTKHLKSTIWDGLYKRKLFINDNFVGDSKLILPFPEEKINEDTYIFPDLIMSAETIIHVSDFFYYYFVRENSLIHSPVTIREINSRDLWKEIHYKLLQITDKYVCECIYNWVCRYIVLLEKIYRSSFKDKYFDIVLNELIIDRTYLLKYISDKKIKRTLNLIHNYRFYLFVKKYLGRLFY